jgi:hypothetical protein
MTEHDITTELWRQYSVVADGKIVNIKINEPVRLYVKRSENGDSHRVVDGEGVTHYIKANWFALAWKGRDGDGVEF